MMKIPRSNALAEATPGSLSELMSRDPEGYGGQDKLTIIEAYRQQRLKLETTPEVKKKASQPAVLAPGEAIKAPMNLADFFKKTTTPKGPPDQ